MPSNNEIPSVPTRLLHSRDSETGLASATYTRHLPVDWQPTPVAEGTPVVGLASESLPHDWSVAPVTWSSRDIHRDCEVLYGFYEKLFLRVVGNVPSLPIDRAESAQIAQQCLTFTDELYKARRNHREPR